MKAWKLLIVLALGCGVCVLYGLVGCGEDDICNDTDGDGYGDPASLLCVSPLPDCDDSDPDVSPGGVEGPADTCNDLKDNDCDGLTDENDVVDCPPPTP